jgi:hypothetical protein
VTRRLAGAALALALLAPAAGAQTPAPPDAAADSFADMLRRTDPDAYARFVKLRDARDRSIADLQRAQDRYRSGGPELRALTLPQLRAARRQYVADTRAFLDFLDDRDRTTIEEYRRAISRLTALLEERRKARAELDALGAE